MNSYDEIKTLLDEIINELLNGSIDDILFLTGEKQSRINSLMEQLAEETGTYDVLVGREKENIESNLTIIDKKTGEEINLVDIDDMGTRVKEVLKTNSNFSCIRALAMSNKIAHQIRKKFHINQLLTDFNKEYEKYSQIFDGDSPELKKATSFLEDFDIKYPDLEGTSKYDLDSISLKDLKKICNRLLSTNIISTKHKKSTLKSLIPGFDQAMSEEAVNQLFEELKKSKKEIYGGYLKRLYNEGHKYEELENVAFYIKNYYTTMIGQLLKSDFKNTTYELIKEDSPLKNGFDYLLIIDDRELSYYVEVHVPNYIGETLIKEYELELNNKRTIPVGGAPAVYKRIQHEVEHIKEALDNHELTKDGESRAKVITRGYDESIPGEDGPEELDLNQTSQKQTTYTTNKDEILGTDYIFITKRIEDKSNHMANYLRSNNLFLEEVEKNELIKNNENYSIDIINKIISTNYFSIYKKLDTYNKYDFINYSMKELENGDAFDKLLNKKIIDYEDKFNINEIAKIIIYKNVIKTNYLNNFNNLKTNEFDFDNNIYNKKEYIDESINNYLDRFLNIDYKEKDKDGQKRTR